MSNTLILELFEILNERNSLAVRRNKARHKMIRYKRILKAKRDNKKKDELALKSDISNDKNLKAVMMAVDNLREKLTERRAIEELENALHAEVDVARGRAKRAEEEFRRRFHYSNKEYREPFPEKYRKIPNSDIKITIFECEVEFAAANLEIAKFTKRTNKRLRQILREMEAHLDSFENRCKGIRTKNGYIAFEKLKTMALDAEATEEIESWLVS